MVRGLLGVGFDFSNAHADEFHDWYDLEHLPERLAVPGFDQCERWISVDNPKHALAIYDLESLSVLKGDAYRSIAYENLSVWSKRVTSMCTRLLRFEGEQVEPGIQLAVPSAGALLINAMNVAPAAQADFNAWYDEEHLPALREVSGTLSARRYIAGKDAAGTHQFVAIYQLETPDVVHSDAWSQAINTPWSARMRVHFQDRLRVLCERYA